MLKVHLLSSLDPFPSGWFDIHCLALIKWALCVCVCVCVFSGGGNKSFSLVWTMPVEGSSSSDMAESSSKPERLDKSKTESQQKATPILAEDAAKIFDDRISAGKKV